MVIGSSKVGGTGIGGWIRQKLKVAALVEVGRKRGQSKRSSPTKFSHEDVSTGRKSAILGRCRENRDDLA
jgi:hypothetical protein